MGRMGKRNLGMTINAEDDEDALFALLPEFAGMTLAKNDDKDIDFSDNPEFGGVSEEEFGNWVQNPKGEISQWIKEQDEIRKRKKK